MSMTAEAQQRRDEVRRAIHTHLCQAVIGSRLPGSPSDMVEVIMAIIAPDLAEADRLRRQLEDAKAATITRDEDALEIVRAGISFIHVAASTLSLVAQWDETETERRVLKAKLLLLLARERELTAPAGNTTT